MSNTQYERDKRYLSALAIVNSPRQKGLVTDSEFAAIDKVLAEKFSPSLAAKYPPVACNS